MNKVAVLVKIRETILSTISDLSIEKLNEIPQGFNNNIVWNFGNVLVSQQGVLYRRTGLDVTIEEKYFQLYKAGTKPEQKISADEFKTLQDLFKEQTKFMVEDFKAEKFKDYNAWQHKTTGIEIDTVDTAIQFLTFHESLHLGYIMALKKAVS